MRSPPARACWPTATSIANMRAGATSCTMYDENAKNVPSVMCPWIASQPPKAEHGDLREHRDRLQQRRVPRLQLDETNPRPVQVLGRVGEVAELALLLAEALHDAHAGDGFVDDAGHFAGALLCIPTRGEDASTAAGTRRP